MQYHKYIAEALGTCVLTLIVALSVAGVFPVSTAVLAAVTLGLFVYTLGHVSGTHLNPAVTLGLLSIGKIHAKDAGGYIASQVIGALVAMLIARMFVPLAGLQGIQSQAVHIGLGELIGAFVFGFGIAAVVYDRAVKEFSGFVIGGSLFIGIALAALMGTNGILNPAVAIGINSFNIMYLVGPIAGAVLGMQTFKYLADR